MDATDQQDKRARIAFVGPCGSGKSTIALRLRGMGYDARMPAQEHSGVPAMWRKLLNPDILVALDAPNPVLRARRPGLGLNDEYLSEQRRRLSHAFAHADVRFDSSQMSEDEIIAAVIQYLEDFQPHDP